MFNKRNISRREFVTGAISVAAIAAGAFRSRKSSSCWQTRAAKSRNPDRLTRLERSGY